MIIIFCLYLEAFLFNILRVFARNNYSRSCALDRRLLRYLRSFAYLHCTWTFPPRGLSWTFQQNLSTVYTMHRIYTNKTEAKKNNYKSRLRTIIPGSEFPSVNWTLRSNRKHTWKRRSVRNDLKRPQTLLNMLVYVHKIHFRYLYTSNS